MQFRKFWMKAAALAVACMTAFGAAGIPAQARVYTMPDGGVFDCAYYLALPRRPLPSGIG